MNQREKGNCARSVDAMRQAASPAETTRTVINELLSAYEVTCTRVALLANHRDAGDSELLEAIANRSAARQSLIDAYKKLERELSDRYRTQEVMLDDVADILVALGRASSARPASAHRVVTDEIIPAIAALRRIANGETKG